MADTREQLLTRWTLAGLIDPATADRIRAHELANRRPTSLHWSVRLALASGALMVGAAALLFVSANWDAMSPAARFGLVIVLVAVFHVGGAAATADFPRTATALHALGTIALGAGIFLTGQIFNLEEHWPGGVMLWAFGAAIGWMLLRDWSQAALAAVLVPAWLISEWFSATGTWTNSGFPQAAQIAVSGSFLLALAYFTTIGGEDGAARGTPLFQIGLASLAPAAALLAIVVTGPNAASELPLRLVAIGWITALGLPVAVSIASRRSAAWPIALAVVWVLILKVTAARGGVWNYVWWAIGAIGLSAWGVREARSERITMGTAIFGATILTFYFSQVMDKLGRSVSLAGFGVLFLAVGWTVERVRRRLLARMPGGVA